MTDPMFAIVDMLTTVLLILGAFFFFAGTVGLLRFPDIYTRLHALAKADNIGLGCVLGGLALQSGSLSVALKLLVIWPLAMAASSAVGFSIARRADALGIEVWRERRPCP